MDASTAMPRTLQRPPGKPDGRHGCGKKSAGLAVRRVLAATRAELRQLHAVGVVAPVLLGDVVALLAHRAGERDLRANVAGLAGHGQSFCRAGRGRSAGHRGSGGGTRTRDTTIMSRVLLTTELHHTEGRGAAPQSHT